MSIEGMLSQLSGAATLAAKMDVRYSFTAQFLCSSAIFARRCAKLESDPGIASDDALKTEHLGLATSAILQSAAAVEAESAELTMHGPGHHLGSNGLDAKALAILAPHADSIDKLSSIERYQLILGLLGKQLLVKGRSPLQSMTTLVKLRNEMIHYKSEWSEKFERKPLVEALQALRLPEPGFVSPHSMFFPHRFLGSASAAWSVHTAVTFINEVYNRLGIPSSPLKAHMSQLQHLPPFRRPNPGKKRPR